MTDRLKISLIGAGVFAGYHANKLAAHDRATFLGVYDPDEERAGSLAKKHSIKAMDLEALLEASDAVVIACPATYHGPTALQALQANCHCLIEKPIATTTTDAEAIVALATEKNRIVQIGHQERMVLQAIGLSDIPVVPNFIRAIRTCSYSPRGTDTSVTMDLMTHDIDICTALFGAAPDEVMGRARAVKSVTPDESRAVLNYGRSTAELFASRVVENGERRMIIGYPSGKVTIDFNKKTLENETVYDLNESFGEDAKAKDSLGAATDRFIAAVLDGAKVLVSAEDGAIAARTAEAIDNNK